MIYSQRGILINERWETVISKYSDINQKNLYQNHQVINGARILPTGKLSTKEIYSILIAKIVKKTTSRIFFEKRLKTQLWIGVKFTCYCV